MDLGSFYKSNLCSLASANCLKCIVDHENETNKFTNMLRYTGMVQKDKSV